MSILSVLHQIRLAYQFTTSTNYFLSYLTIFFSFYQSDFVWIFYLNFGLLTTDFMKELLERTEQLREQVEEKHQQGADTAAATLLSLFLKLPIHPSVNKRSALKVLSSYFIGYGPLACKSTCRHILLFSPWFHSTRAVSLESNMRKPLFKDSEDKG
jgi:hypothetical protein